MARHPARLGPFVKGSVLTPSDRFERLTPLGFPTADVVLFGARLAALVEKLQTQSLAAVLPLDARYAHTLGQNPWVARIVVARIDKQDGSTC